MSKNLQMKAANTPEHRSRLFGRQLLSTMGKIAFWCFLITTIMSTGGAIALALTSGNSLDLDIFAATLLITTILVVTGIRWLQALACLLGITILYQYFTQPFIIESFLNPKGDPNGGFYHFAGQLFPFALICIGLAATIATVLQNYHRISRKTPRWFPSIVGAVTGVVIGALFIGASLQPPTAATLTYTNGVPTVHLSPGSFSLSRVTIPKGSKLLLVDDTSEQHVLNNGIWQQSNPVQKQEPGAPVINHLSLSGDKVTIGPFVTAGTFHIICLIHRGMSLTITVQ
ncbi:MAG TPA: hypothetical protein VKR06_35405 [Ktedonosporobacter sp.]|nr:hypothetical protein [Ktedonosporobacter sp.]